MADRDVPLGLLAELERGFPDATHALDILAPVGTDRAVVCWTFRGGHDGRFFGAPATGREVEINGVGIFRVVDGQFVEQWHVEKLQALFAQIAGEPQARWASDLASVGTGPTKPDCGHWTRNAGSPLHPALLMHMRAAANARSRGAVGDQARSSFISVFTKSRSFHLAALIATLNGLPAFRSRP